MTVADLVQTVHAVPSQVFADLTLGFPLVFFLLLVLASAHVRHRRRTWR